MSEGITGPVSPWPRVTVPEPTPLAPWVNSIHTKTINHSQVRSPTFLSGGSDLTIVHADMDRSLSAVPSELDSFATGFGGDDSSHDSDSRGQQQLTTAGTGMTSATSHRLQDGQWKQRFQELLQYRLGHGHVLVPHLYPPNQKLSHWVKRQRYQRRLKERGLQSTLTDEREQLLADVGFVWDSHDDSWQENFESYERFVMAYGAHCSVPSNYSPYPSLSTWCKHQRRQYKFAKAGLPSTITLERIAKLNSVGFSWNPRNLMRG